MWRTALVVLTASLLWIGGCGDDAAPPSGGGATAGTGGTGGTGGSGGSGGGGLAGAAGADATTQDVSSGDGSRVDAPSTSDAPVADGPSRADVGTIDSTQPPADGALGDGGASSDATSTDAPSSDAPPSTDGASTDGTGDTGADAAAFTLTSSAFTAGSTIPAAHTCAGTNVSPPLQWTPGPAGTMSYAIIFTDRNNGLIHSIIYDIPASVTSLPMNVEKVANPTMPQGAKQVLGYNNMTYGYLGPCPGATAHTYEFMLYAIDVAALPGVTTMSTRAVVSPVILMHDLAMAPLTGNASTMP